MKIPTQKQLYDRAAARAAETNTLFLELVKGMTRKELETNIKRRPALWSRYAGWMNKLP